MSMVLAALAILLASALLCLVLGNRAAAVRWVGPAGMVGAAIVGLIPCCRALIGRPVAGLALAWPMPYGSLRVELDALSALFACAILAICAVAAVYGGEYMRSYEGRRNPGLSWFFYLLLAASMLAVVIARNAILFLVAWEVMALASFFLVMTDSEKESVRRAGWIYLVATHIGTAFLLVMFLYLGRQAGSLDFDRFAATPLGPAAAGLIFLLAVIGFGTKAGFMPLHVWLPEAHPAAPSHVSAVMSGVMIKTGIYGLVRILTLIGPPPGWWGWTLIAIGAVSGILGVLFALAQHDVKRLLAYHSVENIGIIALGLGLGVLGISCGSPAMAALGFAGGLLHVVNHAVFKSLLFMGAGSVLHATGTREMDHLGGLIKRMPVTAASFLVGSVAICGLPPLNGFVSEFLIYLAAIRGVVHVPGVAFGIQGSGMLVIGSLALIGGLAAACFTKAFGVMFLGEPRSAHAGRAHEPGIGMRAPQIMLAAACVAIGFAGPAVPLLLAPAVSVLMPADMKPAQSLADGAGVFWVITAAAAGLVGLAALLGLLRARLLAGRKSDEAVTWDCGYLAPTPRMQYTSSSFAQPITSFFRFILGTRREFKPPQGSFPEPSRFSSETPDVYHERFYGPAFAALEKGLSKFRWLQHGLLNLYILGIVVALLALLAWKLR